MVEGSRRYLCVEAERNDLCINEEELGLRALHSDLRSRSSFREQEEAIFTLYNSFHFLRHSSYFTQATNRPKLTLRFKPVILYIYFLGLTHFISMVVNLLYIVT